MTEFNDYTNQKVIKHFGLYLVNTRVLFFIFLNSGLECKFKHNQEEDLSSVSSLPELVPVSFSNALPRPPNKTADFQGKSPETASLAQIISPLTEASQEAHKALPTQGHDRQGLGSWEQIPKIVRSQSHSQDRKLISRYTISRYRMLAQTARVHTYINFVTQNV